MSQPLFQQASCFLALILLSLAVMVFIKKERLPARLVKSVFLFNLILAMVGILYAIYLMMHAVEGNFLVAILSWTLLSTTTNLLSVTFKQQANQQAENNPPT